jgi:hypothetical protein
LLLIIVTQVFCKKEVKKIIGEYRGTAHIYSGTTANPTLYKDTFYNDVLITVAESSESTRKEPRIYLSFYPSEASPPNRDVSYKDGLVQSYNTSRGEPGVVYTTGGWIKGDSLHLVHKREYVSFIQWEFKARR